MVFVNKEELKELIKNSKKLVFLTGAGVSTPSGIPDYRSLQGVYQTNKSAEYLLSHNCLMYDSDNFYDFVKTLYHPDAKPNIIHKTMAKLEKEHDVTIITQNIDQLHHLANSTKIIEFHGNLYDLYCLKCNSKISVEQYLKSQYHDDGGLIRPDVVLYGENLNENNINNSIKALQSADLIILVGTSFKVYPFASLLEFANHQAKVVLINNDDVYNSRIDYKIIGDAQDVFSYLDSNN